MIRAAPAPAARRGALPTERRSVGVDSAARMDARGVPRGERGDDMTAKWGPASCGSRAAATGRDGCESSTRRTFGEVSALGPPVRLAPPPAMSLITIEEAVDRLALVPQDVRRYMELLKDLDRQVRRR